LWAAQPITFWARKKAGTRRPFYFFRAIAAALLR
jgi:hypothetical protein